MRSLTACLEVKGWLFNPSNHMQVVDNSHATQVKQILAQANITRSLSLPMSDMSQSMFYCHTLPKFFSTNSRGLTLTQLLE
jgi:hypothetical protein